MTINAKRSSLLMSVMLICTITIIGTNYIFTQNIITDENKKIIEKEYEKIGGKENYMIMQEIQRREIIGYIEKIKNEQPELINEILNKKIKKNIFNSEIIDDLRKNTYIIGNTGSLISIIEFSDMECEFCIKQHSKGIKDKILENYSNKVNYMFKNFPLPAHKNAEKKAIIAKCIEKISSKKNYLDSINKLFDNNETELIIKELNIDKDKFEICINSKDIKEVVEREFTQGRMLGIEAIPANLIINNKTGEYIIITGENDYQDIEKAILDISE